MAKIIEFPTKRWKRKMEEALKQRFGTEEAPEELLVYLESLIDDILSKPLRWKFEVSIISDSPQRINDAVESAVNELVQNLGKEYTEVLVGPLLGEITSLRIKLYELEHSL